MLLFLGKLRVADHESLELHNEKSVKHKENPKLNQTRMFYALKSRRIKQEKQMPAVSLIRS